MREARTPRVTSRPAPPRRPSRHTIALTLCFLFTGDQRPHDLAAAETPQRRAEDPAADELQTGRRALDGPRSSGENAYAWRIRRRKRAVLRGRVTVIRSR